MDYTVVCIDELGVRGRGVSQVQSKETQCRIFMMQKRNTKRERISMNVCPGEALHYLHILLSFGIKVLIYRTGVFTGLK